LTINKAEYRVDLQQLQVDVRGTNLPSPTVVLYDDGTGALLSEQQYSRGFLRFRLSGLSDGSVPCTVRVESGALADSQSVENAPPDCGGGPVSPPQPPATGEQPAPGEAGSGDGDHVVFAFNDLGMHCMDLRSVPFSILPPFNVFNAQVVRRGREPQILNDTEILVRYSAGSNPADPAGAGSINTTSRNWPLGSTADNAEICKTDMWDLLPSGKSVVEALFGLNPPPDEGLQVIHNPDHGRRMPGFGQAYSVNEPQAFGQFVSEFGWFTAAGIPMTPTDDQGRNNPFPLMRAQAVDRLSGNVLATIDAVVPVSTEVDCQNCHTLGKVGADPSARADGPQFVLSSGTDRASIEYAAKTNILNLHDYRHGTSLDANQPVLCAGCHASNALAAVGGPSGDPDRESMSRVMHAQHGKFQVNAAGALIRDANGDPVLETAPGSTPLIPVGPGVPMESNCFQCHPGKVTQCFRGAMFDAGLTCSNCHGDMLSVGGEYPLSTTGNRREPWFDEPKCGSCHTGVGNDAVLVNAFDTADPSDAPLPAKTARFAENPGTLYRNSLGHQGVACESCHGSTHGVWPHRDPNSNDNVTAQQLQGHVGPISECGTCHTSLSADAGLNGPHGLHAINDPNWIKGGDFWHGKVYKESPGDQCAVCHGADHLGTRLAKTPVDRVLRNSDGRVLATVAAGQMVACNLCHNLEKSFSK